ncbi:GPI inositol deacylase [Rhodotorula toruloides]
MARSRPPRTTAASRHRTAFPRLSTCLIGLSLASLAACLAIYRAYVATQPYYPPGSLPEDARGGGAGSCRMSFMSPAYMHLSGFGREFTRLGNGPWGLYLYREAGWDDNPYMDDGRGGQKLQLAGTPVLFVPGNAGSFRQVRSLASAASRAWFEVPGVPRKGVGTREGGASLDFFTLDFNDDFSAFHGQTLLDQAEYTADCIRYILSLYAHHEDEATGRNRRPDPTAVIVVGHSMGGVVARAAFLNPNYQSHSISTLITFATPHVVPPVTVDAGVDRVYEAINSYWREAYELSISPKSSFTAVQPLSPALTNFRAPPQEELRDLVLVSIAGGLSDVTIASESVSLASVLPADGSNGFTVFTTAIPGVQTPIDHLAILWCQQLMQTVAQGLLAIVDVRRAAGVSSKEERVAELGRRWLGSLELPPKEDSNVRRIALDAIVRGQTSTQLKVGERLVARPGEIVTGRQTYILPVPPIRTYTGPRVFSLLTSASIGRRKDDLVEVWACEASGNTARGGEGDEGRGALDETEGSSCVALYPRHVATVPSSPHSSVSPILPAPIEHGSISLVSLDAQQLERKESIAVVVKEGGLPWVLAEFADAEKNVHVVEKGALHLLLNGHKLEAFPTSSAMMPEVWLPALDTSLLTLKLRVYRSECQEHTALFAPFLRQHSSIVHESKYFPNVRLASLYTHSSGPYLPPASSPFSASGTCLQFFLDPTCARAAGPGEKADLALEISVDLWATLGALVVRYRMAMVTVPFAFAMLVLGRQTREYNSGAPFPSFGAALSTFSRRTFPLLLAGLIVLSYIQSIALSGHMASRDLLASIEPAHHRHSDLSLPPTWLANLMLGNSGSFWAPLMPLLAFTILSVVAIEYIALSVIVGSVAWSIRQLQARGPARLRPYMTLADTPDTLPLQRVFTMIVLLLLVLFFAPYQFAYLVIVLVHLFSTIRCLILAQEAAPTSTPTGPAGPSSAVTVAAARRLWDRYHYAFSIFFVLVTLLPINALILVVWVRNLAVGWLAPFSSDHNVLMVVGFLANVEALHSGKMLQRSAGGRYSPTVTFLAFVVPAAYSLLYGIRAAHRLYSLANLCFLWLALGTSDAFVGSTGATQTAGQEGLVDAPPRDAKRRSSSPPEPTDDLFGEGGAARKVATLGTAGGPSRR